MNMLKLFKFDLLVMIITIALSISLSSPALAASSLSSSTSQQQACSGLNLSAGTSCDQTASTGIDNLVSTVINLLSYIVGVVSVIMVIIGGFRFMISGGDSAAAASARNTVIYALVGLVIAVLAQVLVHFVLGKIGH